MVDLGHRPASRPRPGDVVFGNRRDFGCSRGQSPREDGIRVVNAGGSCERTAVEPFGTGGGVGRNPEVGSVDREMSDDHVSLFALQTLQLDSAERSRVEDRACVGFFTESHGAMLVIKRSPSLGTLEAHKSLGAYLDKNTDVYAIA
jgi:hypothetical protein